MVSSASSALARTDTATLHGFVGKVGVIVVQGPSFGYGASKLFSVDVVDAHRVADPILEERHALLSVAVFHGIRQTLTNKGNHARRKHDYKAENILNSPPVPVKNGKRLLRSLGNLGRSNDLVILV